MPENQADLIVIGGGIVGLSTAMTMLARFPRLRVIVLEKEDRVAAHQTGHNSGVIHSGVYYKPGSLKATLCVRGAEAMKQFCREHGIAHEVCGKVIVATREDELGAMAEIERRAQANGVPGVQRITVEKLHEIEPHVAGIAALHVPTTGIVDFGTVARMYSTLITHRGGNVHTGRKVTDILRDNGSLVVGTSGGEYRTQFLINCAGLHSDRVARMTGADPDVQIVGFRGEYYDVTPKRRELVRTLIYPVPDPRFPFLGVHFTKKVSGGVEAGPNAVLALKREGYGKLDVSLRDTAEALTFPGFRKMAMKHWRNAVDEYRRSLSKSAFVKGLQRLVPEIREDDLDPGGSGVRAQAIDRNGALVDDFRFAPAERVINVLNVPSPAATASLVIGEELVNLAEKTFGLG